MEHQKLPTLNLIRFGIIYFLMFTIPMVVNSQRPYLRYPMLNEDFWLKMTTDMVFAILIGLAVVAMTLILERAFGLFKEMESYFTQALGSVGRTDVFFIAMFSGLAEEVFFRGFLLHELGIVASSLLFGLLHIGPSRKFLPWTIFAIVMGFLFAYVYVWFNNIMIPALAHVTINYVNLMSLTVNKKSGEVAISSSQA